jgi:valyl-tRNA synthetase
MSDELSTRYDASLVEQKWYARWEEAGLFSPDPDSTKPVFVITIPPPNITGSLHMGHALCYSIQDLLGRYQSLQGKSVLILPGQDHAGIATQSVVEKQLRKEGSSGAQIGREKFVERVWEWRKESGDTIIRQFRRLGFAFDWSRSRFTLDPAYHDAVLKVFIDWFERGLIFKGKRVVNWDPVLKTSVSDIETERRIEKGKLYYIKYPYADGSGHVTIATTRPETMLGDVAIAVHPSDKRYKGKIGKMLLLPLMNREIPLISDIYPDPNFGSGAVKITPAHDPNDYQVGVRHNLPMPVLIDEEGAITLEGGIFAGLDRFEARKRILADLEELGFLEKVEDHEIPLLISDRSGVPIEPLLSEQWFADQVALSKPAIEAVKSGKIKFVPERYERIYLDWMENIREWNLSRQLWWGHRIPIYYDEEGTAYAGLNWDDAQAKAGDKKIVSQEEDVLDTWFSSGLWPFATLGWPENTPDLQHYYPTSVLVTDRNILYLWVARMIMMGIDCKQDIPFHKVYIYATVLTEDGRRMSKSLGTGVDPIQVIDNIGADPLRYTLLSQTGYNQEIRYSEGKTQDARNFCNKIWNAVRFALMNVEGTPAKPQSFELVDQWLLSRLFRTEKAVRESYELYNVQEATQALHKFFWSELCDWYIEVNKKRLGDPATKESAQWVLLYCIEAFVKMLHPIMPHITEEVYECLPIADKSKFLMSSTWPEIPADYNRPEVESRIERHFAVTRALRALRADLGIAAMKPIPVAYFEGDLDAGEEILASQAWIEQLQEGQPQNTQFISATVEGIDLHLPLDGLVDIPKLQVSFEKDLEKTRAEQTRLQAQLSNKDFVERAKPEVVDKLEKRSEELVDIVRKLEERIEKLGKSG